MVGVGLAVCLGTTAAEAEPPAPASAAEQAPPATQPAEPYAAEREAEPAGPRRWLDLEQLSFDLGFDGRFENRQVISDPRRRGDFRFRQTNEEWRFRETVGLRTRGDLFDPRVLNFDVAARWGLEQQRLLEKRPGRDLEQQPTGDLLEYDLRLDILPAGKVSGFAFASQVEDRVPRRFLSSLDRTRERYGAGVVYNDRTLPMRLTWEHSFEQLSGAAFATLDDEDRRQDALRYEATWQPSEYHSLRLDYEHNRLREKYSGTGTRFDTTRNDFTLDHTLRFGAQHEHRMDTFARYQDESGDLARDIAEVTPRLRLQHSDAFSTTYSAQYLRESFQQLTTEQWRGDFGLRQQFGDSLTGSLDLYGLRQNLDEHGGGRGGGADTTEWGGNAGLSLSRENPLGRLSGNLTYSHTALRTANGRRSGIVIAEAVTFRDPQPTYLANRDIEPFSILVTDAGRARTYLPGRDYLVVQVGRNTSLARVRSGRIADGQTVLVSYTYRAFEGFELSRDRIDLRIQQDFKFGLTPYYAGSIQDEDIDRPKFRTFRARNVNRHRLGATYRRPRWSTGLEYEYNDDAIDPFEALHFNADFTLLDRARQQLAANGRLSRFLFDGSEDLRRRDTTLVDLGLTYRCLLGRDLHASAAAAYRFEDDSRFGRVHGIDVTGALEYRIGLFTASLEVEYDVLDLPDSNDETIAVWLKLRREIPVIGQGRGPTWARRDW